MLGFAFYNNDGDSSGLFLANDFTDFEEYRTGSFSVALTPDHKIVIDEKTGDTSFLLSGVPFEERDNAGVAILPDLDGCLRDFVEYGHKVRS